LTEPCGHAQGLFPFDTPWVLCYVDPSIVSFKSFDTEERQIVAEQGDEEGDRQALRDPLG